MSTADGLRAVQIKANFMADKSLGLLEIAASVRDGVAYLTGEVETREQMAFAEELAYSAEGIYEVVNDICVVPDSLKTVLRCTLESTGLVCREVYADDEADSIELELKARLGSAFHGIHVSVSSHNIACVDGSVSSKEELNRLQQIVLRTHGVVGIDSHIEVASI